MANDGRRKGEPLRNPAKRADLSSSPAPREAAESGMARTWELLGGRTSVDLPLVQELPLPVAYSVELVSAQVSPEARVNAAEVAFRCLTRFLALVAMSQYLRDAEEDPGTDKKLRVFLSRRMKDGQWIQILREALRPYARRPETAVIRGLVSFHYHDRSEQQTAAAKAFAGWTERRKKVRHENVATESALAEDLAEEWVRSLGDTLSAVSFLTRHVLLQPVKVSLDPPAIRSARMFRGPSAVPSYVEGLDIPITVGGVKPEESLMLVEAGDPGRQLLVSPLLWLSRDGTLYAAQELLRKRKREDLTDAEYVRAVDGSQGLSLNAELGGEEPFGELLALVARLGTVGAPATPTQLKVRRFRLGEDPWSGIRRWAVAWERAEFAFEVILEFGGEEELKSAIANPTIWTETGSQELAAFVLVAAVHYRLSWLAWSERSATNPLAARGLVSLLDVANRYHRPRLRALYALQLLERPLVEQVLGEGEWTPRNVTIIRRHVLIGKVKEYLRYLAGRSGPHPLPLRAEEVLSEIEPTGPGGIDLPLGPDFAKEDAEAEEQG